MSQTANINQQNCYLIKHFTLRLNLATKTFNNCLQIIQRLRATPSMNIITKLAEMFEVAWCLRSINSFSVHKGRSIFSS